MEYTRGVGDWIGGRGKKATAKTASRTHAQIRRVEHPQSNGDGEEKKEGSLTLDGGFGKTVEAEAGAGLRAAYQDFLARGLGAAAWWFYCYGEGFGLGAWRDVC
jgi:hypothetical protein